MESGVYGKNDILTVQIEDIGDGGEGIGKVNGYTLFVKDAVIGDTVRCKITKAKKKYAYARLMDVLEPSKARVLPVCRCHRQCGGCQIQAMDYQAQLAFKQNKVRNHLIRIGGLAAKEADRVMEPIVGADNQFHYRNKAQFPIGMDKNGKLVAGFYAGRTHDIIPNTDCALGVKENKEVLECILGYMKDNGVTAYDEKTGKGIVRHVLIRKGFDSGELMVCLVVNDSGNEKGECLPEMGKLLGELSQIKGMASISVSVNREKTNVIMGEEVHTLWGKDAIMDTLHLVETESFCRTGKGLAFCISPLSFYQVNSLQAEKLYSLVLEYAQLSGKEIVWDLYCGIGTISLFLAAAAKQVYGLEEVSQAIEDAKRNAERNHIENVEFFVGKAEDVLVEAYERGGISADVIVVDPPRKGCGPEVLETMVRVKPSRIIYVSCDSATLARDLRVLCDGGYRVERVRAIDQFSQTVHVETVALLSLKNDTPKIEVTMEVTADSNYRPKEKATYQNIKKYVKDNFGVNVHTRYIAEVKRMCGLEMGENHHKSQKENPEIKHCPPAKMMYIEDALKYFGLI